MLAMTLNNAVITSGCQWHTEVSEVIYFIWIASVNDIKNKGEDYFSLPLLQ